MDFFLYGRLSNSLVASGILLGGNSRDISLWDIVIQEVSNYLDNWKGSFFPQVVRWSDYPYSFLFVSITVHYLSFFLVSVEVWHRG